MGDEEVEIVTLELDPAEGQTTLVLPGHDATDAGDQDVVLLVERIDEGFADGLELSMESPGLENISLARSVHTFIGELSADSKEIVIRFWTGAGQRIRVTLARFRSGAMGFWRNNRCRACKELVKVLLIAGLSVIGVHLPIGQVVLDAVQTSAFQNLIFGGGPIAWLVQRYGLQPMWQALTHVLGGLNWAFQITDRIFQSVCHLLGFCPPPRAGAQAHP
ncbi:hypothetical protein [Brevundimonas denitrificans]|uniref:hypothetical protein n=1 Tax=Brevundimonas denitrificans TaxID=1443434 RepID=UPI00223B14A8|nr:hypothetical protein [Brevundimonas denitrificans]